MIYLLWPTVRPDMMKATHIQWIKNAINPSKIITNICVNTREQAEALSDDFNNIYISGDKVHGVAPPSYVLGSKLKANPHDIIILASDDFYPIKNWDIPIMTFKCLRQLNGIIYHPDYKHLYSDNELYEVLKSLKLLKNLRKELVVFEHRHYDNGKRKRDKIDNLAHRSSQHAFKTFVQRRKLKVKDKLQVNNYWKKYVKKAWKY